MTLQFEFSSEIASFTFDANAGKLHLLDRQSTVASDYAGLNEPAPIQPLLLLLSYRIRNFTQSR